MLYITVNANEWTLSGQQVNRAIFEEYLRTIIKPYLTSEENIQKTKIFLPTSLTRIDRYNIHRLNIHQDFVTRSSTNEGGDRSIEVVVSKSYLQEIFDDYIFPSKKTEKQILFETLIGFIENKLPEELKNYLNNI